MISFFNIRNNKNVIKSIISTHQTSICCWSLPFHTFSYLNLIRIIRVSLTVLCGYNELENALPCFCAWFGVIESITGELDEMLPKESGANSQFASLSVFSAGDDFRDWIASLSTLSFSLRFVNDPMIIWGPWPPLSGSFLFSSLDLIIGDTEPIDRVHRQWSAFPFGPCQPRKLEIV